MTCDSMNSLSIPRSGFPTEQAQPSLLSLLSGAATATPSHGGGIAMPRRQHNNIGGTFNSTGRMVTEESLERALTVAMQNSPDSHHDPPFFRYPSHRAPPSSQ